jgi:signal transduction histidine kinase
MCQSITEMAQKKRASIDSGEFNALNYSLDVAIAEAVTGFEQARSEASSRGENQRLGFLAHELRNALATVSIAHQLIKKGVVGVAGVTNNLMERNLARMQDLIDRSLTEVQLRGQPAADRRPLRLIEVVDEVEATALPQARLKNISLKIQVSPDLEFNADRHYLISALANLVQNAIKFTKSGGTVILRGKDEGPSISLEVEDTCGGLPVGAAEELFEPFIQKGADRTGVGLGLSISRRAVELNGGVLSVRDIAGRGCIFSIKLEKSDSAEARAQSCAA